MIKSLIVGGKASSRKAERALGLSVTINEYDMIYHGHVSGCLLET